MSSHHRAGLTLTEGPRTHLCISHGEECGGGSEYLCIRTLCHCVVFTCCMAGPDLAMMSPPHLSATNWVASQECWSVEQPAAQIMGGGGCTGGWTGPGPAVYLAEISTLQHHHQTWRPADWSTELQYYDRFLPVNTGTLITGWETDSITWQYSSDQNLIQFQTKLSNKIPIF